MKLSSLENITVGNGALPSALPNLHRIIVRSLSGTCSIIFHILILYYVKKMVVQSNLCVVQVFMSFHKTYYAGKYTLYLWKYTTLDFIIPCL